jgi:hypothetical protein
MQDKIDGLWHVQGRKYIEYFWGNLWRRAHLADLSAVGRIILKRIFQVEKGTWLDSRDPE